MRPVVVGGQPDEAAEQHQHGVLLGADLLVAAEQQAQRGHDQEDAKDVGDPVERGQQRGADRDEQAPGDERAEDPPEQDAVLEVLGDGEEGERRQKDEQVVDGERFFDEPGLEELQPAIGPGTEVDAEVEEQRHADPDDRPDRRLAAADGVRLAVKDAQVEREHRGDDHAKNHPRQRLARRGHFISGASRAAASEKGGLRCGGSRPWNRRVASVRSARPAGRSCRETDRRCV